MAGRPHTVKISHCVVCGPHFAVWKEGRKRLSYVSHNRVNESGHVEFTIIMLTPCTASKSTRTSRPASRSWEAIFRQPSNACELICRRIPAGGLVRILPVAEKGQSAREIAATDFFEHNGVLESALRSYPQKPTLTAKKNVLASTTICTLRESRSRPNITRACNPTMGTAGSIYSSGKTERR